MIAVNLDKSVVDAARAMPARHLRVAVADAVHSAVVKLTQTDGLGQCVLYAVGGAALATAATGKLYYPQVGSFHALVDPAGNGWFHMECEDNGVECGEYHCWFGKAGTPDDPPELVDLSLRNLRKMVDQMLRINSRTTFGDNIVCEIIAPDDGDQVRWTREDDPPNFLWAEAQPPWLHYSSQLPAIKALFRLLPKSPTARELFEMQPILAEEFAARVDAHTLAKR